VDGDWTTPNSYLRLPWQLFTRSSPDDGDDSVVLLPDSDSGEKAFPALRFAQRTKGSMFSDFDDFISKLAQQVSSLTLIQQLHILAVACIVWGAFHILSNVSWPRIRRNRGTRLIYSVCTGFVVTIIIFKISSHLLKMIVEFQEWHFLARSGYRCRGLHCRAYTISNAYSSVDLDGGVPSLFHPYTLGIFP
jgi:hypothetical protein